MHAALLLLTGWTGDAIHSSPEAAASSQPSQQAMHRAEHTHSLGRVLVVSGHPTQQVPKALVALSGFGVGAVPGCTWQWVLC